MTETPSDSLKTLLGYLPDNCWKKSPRVETGDDPDRREESLLDVMPDDPKYTYDIHEVIEKIVDNGEFLELKEDFATHLVTGFCRFGGHVAGLVANNPDELSGILEPDSSDKYDRFMRFLNAFNIPLVTLVDTTAFPPGDRWERRGVIRHGAKLLHSYSHLTCPENHHCPATLLWRRQYRFRLFPHVPGFRLRVAHGRICAHGPRDSGACRLSQGPFKGQRGRKLRGRVQPLS